MLDHQYSFELVYLYSACGLFALALAVLLAGWLVTATVPLYSSLAALILAVMQWKSQSETGCNQNIGGTK